MNVSLSPSLSPNLTPKAVEIQTEEIILGNRKFTTPKKNVEHHTPMNGSRKPQKLNFANALEDEFKQNADILALYMDFNDEKLRLYSKSQKEELAKVMDKFFSNYFLQNGDENYHALYDLVLARFQEGGPLANYFEE